MKTVICVSSTRTGCVIAQPLLAQLQKGFFADFNAMGSLDAPEALPAGSTKASEMRMPELGINQLNVYTTQAIRRF